MTDVYLYSGAASPNDVVLRSEGNLAISITQTASEPLVIAEQAGAVGISIDIAQVASEALIIAEQTGPLALSIDIVQGSTEALLINEQPGTVTLAGLVTITNDGGQYPISDPRHPYWQRRIEEEAPAAAAEPVAVMAAPSLAAEVVAQLEAVQPVLPEIVPHPYVKQIAEFAEIELQGPSPKEVAMTGLLLLLMTD